MGNATDNRNYGGDGAFAQVAPKRFNHKIAAGVEIFAGTFVGVLLSDSDLPITNLTFDGLTEFRGICTQHVNNVGGQKGDYRAEVSCEVGMFNNATASADAVTAAHLWRPVFATDNQTVACNPGTSPIARPCVGILVGFDSTTSNPMVWADFTVARFAMQFFRNQLPVRMATTAALAANTYANGSGGIGATLTGNANGALAAIDGVTPVVGDRILVQNEATAANNGVYVVSQLGTASLPYILTRATDADMAYTLAGATIFVQKGAQYSGHEFALALDASSITVGTTALPWLLIGGASGVQVITYSATPAFTLAKSQQITLTGNITGWTIPSGQADQEVDIFFVQDATGSRTLAGTPANVRLAGNALTLTVTANKVDHICLKWDASLGTPAWVEKSRALNC